MSIQSHIDAISAKRELLKARIAAEVAHANPDFALITQLKKQNLVLKEEMQLCLRSLESSAAAS